MATVLMVSATVVLMPAHSQAQGTIYVGAGPNIGVPSSSRAGTNVQFTILDENKKPLKQEALVRLTSRENGREFLEISRGSVAQFTDVPLATYLVEVGAALRMPSYACMSSSLPRQVR